MKKSYIKFIGTQRKRISKNVFARLLKKKGSKRLELAIIVDEQTRAEDLRAAWPEISYMIEQVKDKQGTNFRSYQELSRFQWMHMYLVEGFSYTEVAMELNYDTLCNLIQIKNLVAEEKFGDAVNIYFYIQNRLNGLGMKHKEIDDWVNPSLKEIGDGYAPWNLTTGPVKKQRVVDAVRQFKREFDSGKIVLKSPPQAEQQLPPIEKIRAGDIKEKNEPTWNEADSLLNQLIDSGGLEKLRKAHMRILNKGVENSG